MASSHPHAFMASGLAFDRARRLHREAESESAAVYMRPDLDDAERAQGIELARRSGQLTRDRLDAALGSVCIEHDALPGHYCWGSRRSRVRGICLKRYQHGVAHPRQVHHPDELAPLAKATRQARSNAAARELERVAKQQDWTRPYSTRAVVA